MHLTVYFWRHVSFLFLRAAEKQNTYLYIWLIPSLFLKILKAEIWGLSLYTTLYICENLYLNCK